MYFKNLKTVITVRLPDYLFVRLDEFCKSHNMSYSQVIRSCLVKVLYYDSDKILEVVHHDQ